MLLAVLAVGVGLVAWTGFTSRAIAGEGVAAAAVATSMPAITGEYEYVGSKKCKKCHMKEHKSWAETKMGQAFNVLKPGEASEAKERFKLDPAKDYTKDETCLPCHTTGFGHAGGYAMPDPNDKKAVKKAKKLESVGCESCHGPGSAYVKVFDEILKSKRSYKVDELYAVGLTKIDATTCTTCHNDTGPTYDPSKPFDFEQQKDQDSHERLPLKQREG
jgi:formate-dependent nitrite reductase cytochrome c552 subunit